MDDLEKKLFAQLDDDMPGVRSNALEALREHLKKSGHTFRDIVDDIENGIPKTKADELEKKLADYMTANAAAAKRDAALTREIATLKAALWVKVKWKPVSAVAAALLGVVVGYSAYERYWSRSEAVTAGLRAAVAAATWSEGWGEPFASKVGGEPYWLMVRGDVDTSSYSDSHGRPVEMRCLHLYATPAQPDSGQYFKPSPRNFLGRVSWPELAIQCKPSSLARADNK